MKKVFTVFKFEFSLFLHVGYLLGIQATECSIVLLLTMISYLLDNQATECSIVLLLAMISYLLDCSKHLCPAGHPGCSLLQDINVVPNLHNKLMHVIIRYQFI